MTERHMAMFVPDRLNEAGKRKKKKMMMMMMKVAGKAGRKGGQP
jgi:hypothetical protein